MDNKTNLTPKERLALFQTSMQQMEEENEVKNVRKLLHEKYLQSKAEEEEKLKALANSLVEKNADQIPKEKKKTNNVKIGRQLAKVFRFENHHFRSRNQPRNREHVEDVDPLLNDPNVLFENFAFDNEDDEIDYRDLPFFPETNHTEDDIEDDSIKSLISAWLRSWTFLQVFWLLIQILIYALGQKLANSYGFGAPYLVLATLVFIFKNLRRKSPHELSAYSVFNPNCRSIPSVSANGMPQEPILLGFGQGLGI